MAYSGWGNAFSEAGSGIDSILARLAQEKELKRAEAERMDVRRTAAFERESEQAQRIREFLADQETKRREMQLREAAATRENLGPGVHSEEELAPLIGTPYGAGVRPHTTLPATQFSPSGQTQSPEKVVPGQFYLPPNFLERRAQAEDTRNTFSLDQARRAASERESAMAGLSPADRSSVILGGKPGDLPESERMRLEGQNRLDVAKAMRQPVPGTGRDRQLDELKLQYEILKAMEPDQSDIRNRGEWIKWAQKMQELEGLAGGNLSSAKFGGIGMLPPGNSGMLPPPPPAAPRPQGPDIGALSLLKRFLGR